MVFILWAETLGEGEVDGTIYQGRNSFTMASGTKDTLKVITVISSTVIELASIESDTDNLAC